MNSPKVGIIYVPFNNKIHFPQVVESWSKLNYPKEKLCIYIATNSNTENCLEILRDELIPQFQENLPEIKFIADGKNDGFAGNHNKGIKLALSDNCDYIYLNNGDLYLHPDSIAETVKLAEKDSSIATVQSLCLYWHDHEKINVAGGAVHIAGHGFAILNNHPISEAPQTPQELAYSSFAACLIRSSILKEIGLIEEGFFMYHEDLEFGLRTRVANYKNILAPKSLAYHDYQFSRNPKKFAWIEKNRYIITLAYYRLPTLILISPILLGVDLASWLFALKGKWLSARFYMVFEFLKPSTWLLIIKMRARMHSLRRVKDRQLLELVTGGIYGQETDNWIVEKISNPLLNFYVKFLQIIIFW